MVTELNQNSYHEGHLDGMNEVFDALEIYLVRSYSTCRKPLSPEKMAKQVIKKVQEIIDEED